MPLICIARLIFRFTIALFVLFGPIIYNIFSSRSFTENIYDELSPSLFQGRTPTYKSLEFVGRSSSPTKSPNDNIKVNVLRFKKVQVPKYKST